MNILIIAATENEIAPICQKVTENGSKHTISFIVTGVGIASTVYVLTKELLQNTYDLILNVGIAGHFSDTLKIGDVVAVKSETFADWGVNTVNGFKTVFDEGIVKNDFPFHNGELICPHIGNYAFFKNLQSVKGITVNAVNGEPLQIERVENKFLPDIESMEGAAFFYVCMQEGIPFIEIRSISNKVEKRDKSKWNIPLAIKNLSDVVLSFVNL